MKGLSLAKQGGFSAIYERLQYKIWTQQDKQVLITQIRVKALHKSRVKSQDKDRGGCAR